MKKSKKIVKAVAYIAGGNVLFAAAYVFRHKPDLVTTTCFRSCHCANGCPKKAFDKAWQANLQSVKQLLRYGEVCNSYQVGNKFYTGHSKTAFCKNINPFK